MPIETVQENWGVANSGGTTTLTIPLTGGNNPSGTGTTAGNTVIIFLTGIGGGLAAPTGWVTDRSHTGALYVFCGSDIAAGETSWTVTVTATSSDYDFYVVELEGVDPVVPLEASAVGSAPVSNGGTLSTGTTPLNAALDTVAFAAFAADAAVSPTWSGYTNGFEEAQEVTTGGVWRLAVARKFVTGQTGTFETTATLASTGTSNPADAIIVVYRAADSPIVAPLAAIAGFEWGTNGGLNSHTGTTSLMGNTTAHGGTWGTTQVIQAGSARNSSYGCRVVQTGASGNMRLGTIASRAASAGVNVRVVSATGTVIVALLTNATVLYDSSTNKFGVRCVTAGTVSWQSGTTPLNTWVWIDLRIKSNTSTFRAEWRIEEGGVMVEQAAAELTGQTPANNTQLTMGSTASQTMTADYDDACLTSFWAAYPLGPHQVRLLVPNVNASVLYSGTPGNFAIVASNATSTALAGSGGTITTTGVPDRLDEVPPTISSAADGVVQTATAASDYLQFDMVAPTVADDEVIVGVRMLAALISTTGAGAGDLAIRGWDGTAETALASVSQVTPSNPTAVSSTAPRWLCAMWQKAAGWTKAALAAAALRFGFSGDATPDMGAEVLYIEYATRKAEVVRLAAAEDDTFTVDTYSHPNTLGTVALKVVVPPGDRGATLEYVVDGNTNTVDNTTLTPGTTHIEPVDAESYASVSRVTLMPDPKPEPE